MYRSLGRFVVVVAAVSLLVFRPERAIAQPPPPDCGTKCKSCPGNGYEGYMFSATTGHLNMQCFPNVPNCIVCGEPEARSYLSNDALHIAAILRKGTRAFQLPLNVENRLLLSPRRQVVAIKGSPCDPEAIVAVLFVNRDQMSYLKTLGLPDLDRYLSRSAQRPTSVEIVPRRS